MNTSKLINQEIAIVVAVKTQNPAILNEDFLKYSGIVPPEWKLAQAPSYTDRVAQVLFTNGFSLAVQPDRVMFLEALGETKQLDEIAVAEVASRYVDTLKLADYQAVGINCRGYVSYVEQPDEANKLVTQNFLAPGSWQIYKGASAQASVNLVYDFPTKKLNLSINEAELQFPDQEPTPVALFAGNFNYNIATAEVSDRLTQVKKIIAEWQEDANLFTDLVGNHIIKK
jgi:menaquinone-dependent protoporphyrinogen IX oxidase